MKVSLIITTYNWPQALRVVLDSIAEQSVLPNEVIVADDGSTKETSRLIEQLQSSFPLPIIHSWQEDKGFRAARSRNRAIAKAQGDYIVMIDGDMFLSPFFVEDHIASARKGFFVQGGRAMLSEQLAEQCMAAKALPHFFQKGIKNRKNTIRNRWLSKIFSRVWNDDQSTRTCNMAVWRSDLVATNGFNEAFEGWGKEDSELVVRLLNSGLQRYYLKFSAIAYHLYHQENKRDALEKNVRLLQATIKEKSTRCEMGLDQHL